MPAEASGSWVVLSTHPAQASTVWVLEEQCALMGISCISTPEPGRRCFSCCAISQLANEKNIKSHRYFLQQVMKGEFGAGRPHIDHWPLHNFSNLEIRWDLTTLMSCSMFSLFSFCHSNSQQPSTANK